MMNTDRLVSLLKHEANNHGQCDYKHEAAARLEEITSKLAESERHRQILTQQNAELVRRVKALEEALVKIRDYNSHNEPDEQLSLACTQAFEESNDCAECKRIRTNKWPPSGLCSVHYTKVARAREALDYDFEHRQRYEPRNIARVALEATCKK